MTIDQALNTWPSMIYSFLAAADFLDSVLAGVAAADALAGLASLEAGVESFLAASLYFSLR